MADTKTGEEHIRKLQRTGTGGRSYALTLPKQFVQDLGWRERQKLVVRRDGDDLVISDWSG